MSSPVVHSFVLPYSEQASRLAPEIHDMILDNIRSSKSDLSNCSLVCRSWLHLCRYYLFSEVNYRSDFARFLSSSPHAGLTVASYIRKVAIKSELIGQEDKDFLVQAAFQLPEIKILRLERFFWGGMQSPSTLALGTSSSHRLSILELQSVSFTSFKTLADCLNSLSALQGLSLDNVSWDALDCSPAKEGSLQGSTPKQYSLKNLHVASCHNIVVFNWLLYGIISDSAVEVDANSRRQFPHLVALSFPDILSAEAKLLSVFFASLGEILERLEFGLLVQNNDSRSLDDISRPIDLSINSNLKSVVVRQITLFQFPSLAADAPQSLISSPYAWIPSFISTIRSTVFQSIEFRMWFSNEAQLDTFPWSELSSALKIGIPNIRFHISGIGRDTDLVEEWITSRIENIDQDKATIQFDFLG